MAARSIVCDTGEAVIGAIVPGPRGGLAGGVGGRHDARILALLAEAVEALEDARFPLRGLAWRAGQALAGHRDWRTVLAEVQQIGSILDGPHRALYAQARFEERHDGQLALPMNADRRAVA